METRHDEEFGLMTAQGGGHWVLEHPVLLDSESVAIEVELDEENKMEPQQRQAIRYALALGPDALDNAAPAVVQNYEVYREAIDDDEQTPSLEKPVDVWRQVQIASIWVPRHYEARHAYFLIYAECDWDAGHGLEIRFCDGVAIESDQVGGSGGARDDTPEHLAALRQLIADASSKHIP